MEHTNHPVTRHHVEALRAEWRERLQQHPAMDIQVSDIDLEGMKLVIQLHQDAAELGRRLEFLSPDPLVGEALGVCRWFSELMPPKN
jgi:hypothetical protein